MASIARVELELSHRRNSGVAQVGGVELIVEDSQVGWGLRTRRSKEKENRARVVDVIGATNAIKAHVAWPEMAVEVG